MTAGTLAKLDKAGAPRRLWAKDPTLWKARPEDNRELADRLGWLKAPEAAAAAAPELSAFADEVRRGALRDVVLLGMGGSSLCPDVLRRTFSSAAGFPDMTVLDSTVPAAILAVRRRIQPGKTLFIVSSKSGGTLETACLYEFFRGEVAAAVGPGQAGHHFVAVTDPGTAFHKQAQETGFRRVFLSDPEVGGRYSALTAFGIVPAALLGMDLKRLAAGAQAMAAACGPGVPASKNPAFQLGAWLGEGALKGRNKITFILSPGIAAFGAWAEQLIAESTGKEGKGLLPVDGEEPRAPEDYGEDRLFAYIRLSSSADRAQDAAVERLEKAGRPVLRFDLQSPYDIGGEFFRWEAATAVAGMVLGINAFDQPNVQEAKDLAKSLLGAYQKDGEFPDAGPAVSVRDDPRTAAAALTKLLGATRPPGYAALLAYVDGNPAQSAALAALRREAGKRTTAATTLGLGPRYLHSTGQLHKGGPVGGAFVELVSDSSTEAAIPGRPFAFGALYRAQAVGDAMALRKHGRTVLRLDLGGEPDASLARLAQELAAR